MSYHGIYLPYGLRFSFGYWVSLSTVLVRPYCYTYNRQVSLQLVLPTYPSGGRLSCRNADQITILQAPFSFKTDWAFRIVRECENDKRTVFCLADEIAAGSTHNPNRQVSSAKQGIARGVGSERLGGYLRRGRRRAVGARLAVQHCTISRVP